MGYVWRENLSAQEWLSRIAVRLEGPFCTWQLDAFQGELSPLFGHSIIVTCGFRSCSMPVRIGVTESSLTYLDCLLVELSKGVQGIRSGFPTHSLELPWAQCLQCRCVSLMSKFCFLHHIYTVVSTFLSLSSHTLSAFIEDSSSTLLVRECLEFKELYCHNFTSIPLDRC